MNAINVSTIALWVGFGTKDTFAQDLACLIVATEGASVSQWQLQPKPNPIQFAIHLTPTSSV